MKQERPEVFEDVAASFSKEQWERLSVHEKKLYKEVIKDNYETMTSLGFTVPKENLLSLLQQEEAFPICVIKEEDTHVQDLQDMSIDSQPTKCEKEYLLEISGHPLNPAVEKQLQCTESGRNLTESLQIQQQGHSELKLLRDTTCEKRHSLIHSFATEHLATKLNETFESAYCKNIPQPCSAACPQPFNGEQPAEYTNNRMSFTQKSFSDHLKLSAEQASSHAAPEMCGTHQPFPKSDQHIYTRKNVLSFRNEFSLQDTLDQNPEVENMTHKLKPYKCNYCWKSFTQKVRLSQHQWVHTGVKPFICRNCGRRFTRLDNMSAHQKTHRGQKHMCKKCNRSFTSLEYLLQHQLTHKREKPFMCSTCGRCFIQETELNTHKWTHRETRLFRCIYCGKSFTQKVWLLQHECVQLDKDQFTCKDCGKKFAHQDNLSEHQKIHQVHKCTCLDCGKCFSHMGHLLRHQKVHKREKTFKCSTCEKTFTQKSALITHQWIHTGSKPFKCSKCWKCFSQKVRLTQHQWIHTGKKPFPCKVCGKTFTRLDNLSQHQKNHTGSVESRKMETTCKSFESKNNYLCLDSISDHQKIPEAFHTCMDCGSRFAELLLLLQHQQTHGTEKQFTDTECGNTFTLPSSLTQQQQAQLPDNAIDCADYMAGCRQKETSSVNLQIQITEDKPNITVNLSTPCIKNEILPCYDVSKNLPLKTFAPADSFYKCSYCLKSFTQQNELFQHEWIHRGKTSFTCNDCRRSFTCLDNLVEHQRLHREEKHTCTNCGNIFTCLGHLLRHVQIHTGEKPFNCSKCGKQFSQKSALSTHQRIHAVKKPFKCSNCGKCFSQRVRLSQHQWIHTGKKPFPCNVCGKTFTRLDNLSQHQKVHKDTRSKKVVILKPCIRNDLISSNR